MDQILRGRLVKSLGNLSKQRFLVFEGDFGVDNGRSELLHNCSQSRSLRTVGDAKFKALTKSFFGVSSMRHFDKSSLDLT